MRYVADGQRFGFHDENILEELEIPLGRDVYKVAEFSAVTLVLGIIFTKWHSIKTFTKRVYLALRREFRNNEVTKDE